MKLLNISRYSSVVFIILLALLHLIDSNVNPKWQPISEYALGKMGWLMNIAFCSLGVSFLGLGYYIVKNIPRLGSKVGGWLLIVSSVGNFIAAIWNTDPAGTTAEQMTTSGQIHSSAAGLLGFMVLATLFILYQFYRQEVLNKYKNKIFIITALLWLFEISLIVTLGVFLSKTNGILTPETAVGWLGRVVIVCCAIWIWICSTLFINASNINLKTQMKIKALSFIH